MEPSTDKEYEKRKEEMRKKIGEVKGAIAKKVKAELATPDKEKRMKCDLAYKIFHEGVEMYQEGELTFKEFTEDLYKTLKAIE